MLAEDDPCLKTSAVTIPNAHSASRQTVAFNAGQKQIEKGHVGINCKSAICSLGSLYALSPKTLSKNVKRSTFETTMLHLDLNVLKFDPPLAILRTKHQCFE
jgi:hypothetical protein